MVTNSKRGIGQYFEIFFFCSTSFFMLEIMDSTILQKEEKKIKIPSESEEIINFVKAE